MRVLSLSELNSVNGAIVPPMLVTAVYQPLANTFDTIVDALCPNAFANAKTREVARTLFASAGVVAMSYLSYQVYMNAVDTCKHSGYMCA